MDLNYATCLMDIEPPLKNLDAQKTARVLLIEDDRSTRRMVSASLKGHCNLIEAPNASQGISSYDAFQPDLVLMDIELPDGNGQNLLSWITRNDPNAFVVMFSGYYDSDNVMESIERGARGFMPKPFNLEKMMNFIELCPRLN